MRTLSSYLRPFVFLTLVAIGILAPRELHAASTQTLRTDDFLRGYISSVLERELQWPRSSYRLSVTEGVATLTIAGRGDHRRGEALDRLRGIDGLAGLNVTISTVPFHGESANREALSFPTGDVFHSLIADPKQPQFFMSLRHYSSSVGGNTIGAVAYGETFGMWRRPGERPGDGVQISVAGGLFAQFDLDAPSRDLVNADYTVGLPVTFRRGPASARLRIYHQSSHLGDEFLLHEHPLRVNLSYESLEALGSYDWKAWRIYGGGEHLFDRDPASLKPLGVHSGIEYRGPTRVLHIGRFLAGVDMKNWEQHDWSADVSALAGFEFGSADLNRSHFRLMAEFYSGHSPNGQFYQEYIRYEGLGAYFGF